MILSMLKWIKMDPPMQLTQSTSYLSQELLIPCQRFTISWESHSFQKTGRRPMTSWTLKWEAWDHHPEILFNLTPKASKTVVSTHLQTSEVQCLETLIQTLPLVPVPIMIGHTFNSLLRIIPLLNKEVKLWPKRLLIGDSQLISTRDSSILNKRVTTFNSATTQLPSKGDKFSPNLTVVNGESQSRIIDYSILRSQETIEMRKWKNL